MTAEEFYEEEWCTKPAKKSIFANTNKPKDFENLAHSKEEMLIFAEKYHEMKSEE
jgi:hypothetical protein